MFLTPADLVELTGYTLPSRQREWLDGRGWVYEVSRLGTVKVLRRYAEMKLGMPVKAEAKASEPDFTVFGARG